MSGPHILVFPYPAQGHMLPLLDLTHHLALHGFAITVLVTPKNLSILSPLLTSQPSKINQLVLPFPQHPNIPPGVENVKDLGIKGTVPMVAALSKLHDPLLLWFQSHNNPPVAIISDFFLGWTTHLAAQLQIPRLVFYSSGAFAVSIIDSMWNNIETVLGLEEVTFSDLPGAPVFKNEHLPSVARTYTESNPDMKILRDLTLANASSWAIVFNTFEGLESRYLEHFKRKAGHDRVFGVGPLNLIGPDSSSRGRLDTESVSSDEVLAWLDGWSDGSVVYVCFGSQKVLSNEQAQALAHGLEESGTRFVWVMKPATTQQAEGLGHLPHGFENRVAGRGLVIKGWAPQVPIVSHRAVGGFLSHCGWNSVLEGIVGGVMILAWPMEADQFLDARLLVEELGVGVRVCEGTNSVPDPAKLSRLISESMREGGEVKVRARELRDEALAAVSERGSSRRDASGLVEQLQQLKLQMN